MGKYVFSLGYRLGIFFDHVDDTLNFKRPEDYPCRLSNLQSIIGLDQLRFLEQNLSARRNMVKRYLQIVRDNGIDHEIPSHSCEMITLRFSLMLKNRDAFIKKWDKYFEVGQWFNEPALGWGDNLSKLNFTKGSCPVAERVHNHIINFPTHQSSPRIRNFLYDIVNSIRPEDVLQPSELLSTLTCQDNTKRTCP
jgi:hypothetical protein